MDIQEAFAWCQAHRADVRAFPDHFRVEVYVSKNHYEAFRAATFEAAVARARMALGG
jgi:hypothetical protein